MNSKVILVGLIIVILIGSMYFIKVNKDTDGQIESNNENDITNEKFKILHIMSYHSPWKWTDDQLNGFKDVLKDYNIEYMVYQMDTKNNSTAEHKEKAGEEARALIEEWQPDLVYTNDDNAQIYVSTHYINSSIPFVFSGVNAEPEAYGFVGSTNMAGVLERVHFVETVNLVRDVKPAIKKIAMISDNGPTWPPMIASMKSDAGSKLPELEFICWDIVDTYEEYKQKINEYQDTVDAIGYLGIFTFTDDKGNNVPYDEVMKWTVENSDLPDFSFWADRIQVGNLAAMTVSGFEQGKAAGEIAKGILVDKEDPQTFGFESTSKGEPVVNLARASRLGIQFSSDILLTANVIENFAWEA